MLKLFYDEHCAHLKHELEPLNGLGIPMPPKKSFVGYLIVKLVTFKAVYLVLVSANRL